MDDTFGPPEPEDHLDKKTKSQPSQVYVFDWRWTWSDKLPITLDEFKAMNKDVCDVLKEVGTTKAKFIFQLECTVVEEKYGSHENWHYQGYLNLPVKRRPLELGGDLGHYFPGVHVSPCSTAGKLALKAYCMKKDETYRSGPWCEKGEIEAPYAGEDLVRHFRPWQQTIVDDIKKTPDPRIIRWVYDQKGGIGKSEMAKYLEYNKLAECLHFDSAANLAQQVLKVGARKCYIFDLARTKTKSVKMEEIYTTLESIKNGHIKSGKYEGGTLMMKRPHVWVFSNYLPDLSMMSPGRFEILTVDEHFAFVKYEPEPSDD